MNEALIPFAVKVAQRSMCKHKVSAIGFDRKGNIIGYSHNLPRFSKYGGGLHAEMRLMAKYGKHIKTIVICRTNISGDLKAIAPCKACAAKASDLGIKILTIGK